MSVEENLRLSDELIEAANTQNWNRFLELLAESTTWYGPGDADVFRGAAEAIEGPKSFVEAFPDLHREKRRSFGVGDWVCLELVLTGTHKGPFELAGKVIPPTDRKIRFGVCLVAKFEGGKMVEGRFYFNEFDILTQLGAAL